MDKGQTNTYLVIGGELLAVGSEGQQSARCVHQTANLQAVVIPRLTGACAFPSPDHVAVTALYAGER